MQLVELLKQCCEINASDLHLSPKLPPIVRVDGVLLTLDYPMLDPVITKQLIYSVMEKSKQVEFESKLDIDFAISIADGRFRVNVFKVINGIAAVFRVVPPIVPTLDELEMPEIFKQILHYPNGLILVTGPTGSGKSTTLAAMINYINTYKASHVITIEDPIEFVHASKMSLINQREVVRDTQDFNSALRAALREDPDVILIGEMRDLETMRLALTAAETGHLILATLHTSSAARAINRIVDVFPAGEKNMIRNMLSESLQAVICQKLIKKQSKGRVPAFEIMLGSSAIRNLIREDKIAQMYSVIQTGNDKGMCTFEQYLQKLILNNRISQNTASDLVNKEIWGCQ